MPAGRSPRAPASCTSIRAVPDGAESLEPDDVAKALLAIRSNVPGTPVGLSTHWRIPPGGRARHEPMEQWQVLPDYVSVNLIEEDAAEVISLVLARGIGVEAGIWSISDAERFVTLPDANKCLRVLIEINEQDIDEGLAAATGIISVLDAAGSDFPFCCMAMKRVYGRCSGRPWRGAMTAASVWKTAICLPSGKKAADNADIVRAAVLLARAY